VSNENSCILRISGIPLVQGHRLKIQISNEHKNAVSYQDIDLVRVNRYIR